MYVIIAHAQPDYFPTNNMADKASDKMMDECSIVDCSTASTTVSECE